MWGTPPPPTRSPRGVATAPHAALAALPAGESRAALDALNHLRADPTRRRGRRRREEE